MITKIKPYLSRFSRTLKTKCCGKIAKSIFEPSSGGIGKRLNIAKTMFINTIPAEMFIKASEIPKAGAK